MLIITPSSPLCSEIDLSLCPQDGQIKHLHSQLPLLESTHNHSHVPSLILTPKDPSKKRCAAHTTQIVFHLLAGLVGTHRTEGEFLASSHLSSCRRLLLLLAPIPYCSSPIYEEWSRMEGGFGLQWKDQEEDLQGVENAENAFYIRCPAFLVSKRISGYIR